MSNAFTNIRSSQVSSVVQAIQKDGGLQFREVFPIEQIDRVVSINSPGHRDRIYPPDVTLFSSMHQALSSDKSLREAVARANTDRIAAGLDPASSNTAALTKARKLLPLEIPQLLSCELAHNCESIATKQYSAQGNIFGRKIKLVDGSTLLMPDTPENQSRFPQIKSQELGSGFPIARIVGIFSLLTGAVFNLAIGPYKGKETGEHALLREILHCFEKDDILIGDAYYSSYFLMATLLKMGVDFLFETHGGRSPDFRTGVHLGKYDHLLKLERPSRPDWMDEETYSKMPISIKVREVAIVINFPGFRSKKIILTTSFLNPKMLNKIDLGNLYRQRWMVEVDLAAIKTTMKMEMLRSKSPAMVIKEIWIHLLAYNAIRKIILDSAIKHSKLPCEISFKATIQTLNHYSTLWRLEKNDNKKTYNLLLDSIINQRVGNRPGRQEPRKRKRRPKPFPLLHGNRNKSKIKNVLKITQKKVNSIYGKLNLALFA